MTGYIRRFFYKGDANPSNPFQYAQDLNETITIVDTLTKSTSKTLNENITIVDTLTKAIAKSFNEIITIVDTLTKNIAKSFNEVVTLVDTLTKNTAKSFNEIITIVDTLGEFLLNSVRAGLAKIVTGVLGGKPEGMLRDHNKPEMGIGRDRDKPEGV